MGARKGGVVISVSSHIDIERTPEEVWSFLMDPANDPLWERSVMRSRWLDEGPIGVGSRARKTVAIAGARFDVDLEFVEYQAERHASVVIIDGPIEGGRSYSVEEIPGGTRLTYGIRHGMSGPLRLAEPALRRAYRKHLAQDLATLKLAVETTRDRIDDRRN
jgi:carbon monoxide dehydrogenase subunit G